MVLLSSMILRQDPGGQRLEDFKPSGPVLLYDLETASRRSKAEGLLAGWFSSPPRYRDKIQEVKG